MKKLLSLILILTLALGCLGALAEGAADGTYTASAEGKDGPVVVETTFEGGKIVKVEVTEQNEAPEIAGLPLEQIPPAIVEANAWNVDSSPVRPSPLTPSRLPSRTPSSRPAAIRRTTK